MHTRARTYVHTMTHTRTHSHTVGALRGASDCGDTAWPQRRGTALL